MYVYIYVYMYMIYITLCIYIYEIYIILCVYIYIMCTNIYGYVYHVYYMNNLCVYIYIRLVCFSEKYLCVCCTLAFKCSMSSAGSSGMTGTGSDSTGCSSDLHKKSQVKEMNVSFHKIEAFRSCSRFHTLCISSLLVLISLDIF